MGLAASQGRYLALTARMSDLVYEGQQISQQRLALANQSQAIADEYNDALNNTIIVAKTGDGETQQLSYSTLISQDPFSGLCMRIVDLNGNVVVPKDSYTEDEDGNKEYTYAYLKNEDEKFSYDEFVTDPAYLQQMLESGEYLIEQLSSSTTKEWASITWQGSSVISEIRDTSDDAAAEAKYEAATQEIQRQDKILELRLEQVETEEKSVETEIDSVKEIIDGNIEESFKTFA